METPTISPAQKKILDFIDKYNLTMKTTFIPFSKSKHAKPNIAGELWRSLNWKIVLSRNGREVLTTDYAAGEGSCPSYKQGELSIDEKAAIDFELEQGKRAALLPTLGVFHGMSKPILPDFCDVLSSLALDATAIDYPTYEQWGPELGYDVDSRKGEAIYRQCLEIGLMLRAGMGETGLTELREACQDY